MNRTYKYSLSDRQILNIVDFEKRYVSKKVGNTNQVNEAYKLTELFINAPNNLKKGFNGVNEYNFLNQFRKGSNPIQ